MAFTSSHNQLRTPKIPFHLN